MFNFLLSSYPQLEEQVKSLENQLLALKSVSFEQIVSLQKQINELVDLIKQKDEKIANLERKVNEQAEQMDVFNAFVVERSSS